MMAKYSLRPHEKIDYKSLDSGILPDKTGGDVSGETNDEHDDDDHEEWEELMAQVAKEEKRKEELLQLNENAKRKQEKQELKEKIAKLKAENTDTESKLKDQKVTPKDLLAFEPLAKEVEKKLAKMGLADAAHEDSSGDESSGSSSSTEQEKCKAKREFGWPVGYLYDVCGFPISELRNHKGATTFPDELNKYLEEELSRGSVAGPFDSIPFSRAKRPKALAALRRAFPQAEWDVLTTTIDAQIPTEDKFHPAKWLDQLSQHYLSGEPIIQSTHNFLRILKQDPGMTIQAWHTMVCLEYQKCYFPAAVDDRLQRDIFLIGLNDTFKRFRGDVISRENFTTLTFAQVIAKARDFEDGLKTESAITQHHLEEAANKVMPSMA
ncbi:hypothetical protein QZH41_007556 [Actinostola sp. cb2023]|nr:hypothetical protein QZH41_007556 [Actinostola sp. cb2023]